MSTLSTKVITDYYSKPIVQKVLDSLMTSCPSNYRMKLLGVLRRLSKKALEEKMGFQKFHFQFLKLAIENRCYHMCLDVIEHPVVIVTDISFENVLCVADAAAGVPLSQFHRADRLRTV